MTPDLPPLAALDVDAAAARRIRQAMLAEAADPWRRYALWCLWRDRIEPTLVALASIVFAGWAIAATIGG